MFRDAFNLALRDASYLLRRRETVLWTFVMPIVFFYFIGTITGNSAAQGADPIGVSIPADAGFLADQLLTRLEQRGYHVDRVTDATKFLQYRRRLTIPAGFTESALAGKQVTIQFERTGEDMSADYDRARLARAVYTTLADLIVVSTENVRASKEAFEKLGVEPRTLTLKVQAAGKRNLAPSGFEQSVPGTMVMFTMLVLFTTGGVSLTVERNHGILRRLASSPMPRGAVVLGKWGARMALGIIQIAFAMVTGSILFHIHWGPNLPMIALILLAYGGLAAALGMLLGNFGRSEAQVIGLGVLASNVLAGLGGCWWPVEVTPLWTQRLALALPTGWAMDALHKLVNFGTSPASVLPHLLVTSTAGLVAGYLLTKHFRFQ